MATITTTGSVGGATFGGFLPAYWDSVLGENLYPNLFLYQFGTKRTIPRNFGKVIKIPRYKKMTIMGGALTEGTPLTAVSAASAQFISGILSQFGGVIKHSDLLLMTAMSDFVELSLSDLARDLAKKIDNRIRDQISGIGIGIGGTKGDSVVGGTAYSTSVGTLTGILKPKFIIRAATRLDDANNSRPPDQYYPTIIAPRAVYDIQTNTSGGAWLDVTKYQEIGAPRIYQGEVGRMYGARFVTSTEMKRLNAGLSTAAISGYRSFMFAPNSYYVTELNGDTAKTFVKQLGSAGTADPINQNATVGAKVYFGVVPATWTATEYKVARLVYSTTF